MSFIKKNIFGTFRDPWSVVINLVDTRPQILSTNVIYYKEKKPWPRVEHFIFSGVVFLMCYKLQPEHVQYVCDGPMREWFINPSNQN